LDRPCGRGVVRDTRAFDAVTVLSGFRCVANAFTFTLICIHAATHVCAAVVSVSLTSAQDCTTCVSRTTFTAVAMLSYKAREWNASVR